MSILATNSTPGIDNTAPAGGEAELYDDRDGAYRDGERPISARRGSHSSFSSNSTARRPSASSSDSGTSTITALSSPSFSLRTLPSQHIRPHIEVRSSESRNLGLFATQCFVRGEIILVERALFAVPDLSAVESTFSSLSPVDQGIALDLANSFSTLPIARGIFETNAFSLSPNTEAAGLFPLTARFNHSCSPTARASYDKGQNLLITRALTTIARGDEIYTSYLSPRDMYASPRATRQRHLGAWGFVCLCSACSLPPAALKLSDRRRLRLAAIYASLPDFDAGEVPKDPVKLLHAIGRARRMLVEEGFHSNRAQFDSIAYEVCAYSQDFSSAARWAGEAGRNWQEELGEASELVLGLRRKEEDPEGEWMHGHGIMGQMLDLSVATDEALGAEPGLPKTALLAKMFGLKMSFGTREKR